MFACLYAPPAPARHAASLSSDDAPDVRVLVDIARTVSPRVAARSRHQIVIGIDGLERLLGDAHAIGERLRQAAADRGISPVHVAVAGTCTAAMLLAAARTGVTVVAAGEEIAALAPLPLKTLTVLAPGESEDRRQETEDRRQKTEARNKKPEGVQPAATSSPEPEIARDRVHPERAAAAASRRASAQRLAPSPKSPAPNPQSPIPNPDCLAVLARWGLRTLGELAALPAADLSERLGQDGIRWQRLARGEDTGPLVPAPEEDPFEASLQLEWPVEELEPLSFVLARLLEPLCRRLEYRDRGAAVLHLRLRLVTRDLHLRSLQLPAPMRDPKVLRTLLLLDLESHPAPAGIDAVTLAIEPTPGRIVQESLLARALPAPELVSTLVARLQALMGEGKCGSPMTVDSYRPGAFAMTAFSVGEQKPEARSQKPEVASSQYSVASRPNPESRPSTLLGAALSVSKGRIPNPGEPAPSAKSLAPGLRRFRLAIPARVLIDGNRPVSVRTERPALAGGRVLAAAGPWRTSGEWWNTPAAPAGAQPSAPPRRAGWNRDEWDVALSDGGLYRIFEDRDTGRWFVGAVVD
jgi:protein ImuB